MNACIHLQNCSMIAQEKVKKRKKWFVCSLGGGEPDSKFYSKLVLSFVCSEAVRVVKSWEPQWPT